MTDMPLSQVRILRREHLRSYKIYSAREIASSNSSWEDSQLQMIAKNHSLLLAFQNLKYVLGECLFESIIMGKLTLPALVVSFLVGTNTCSTKRIAGS